MSSGWFDWTETSLTTALQGRQGVQGALCTSSMRFKHRELKVCRVLSHEVGVVQL